VFVDPLIPTWVLKAPLYQFTLSSLGSKSEVSPTVYKAWLNELLSDYDGYTRIYTDGSKIGEAAGASAVLAHQVSNRRLSNHSSIFTAEARDILLALDMARRCSSYGFLVLSDSFSCMQSMRNRYISRPRIAEFSSSAIRFFQVAYTERYSLVLNLFLAEFRVTLAKLETRQPTLLLKQPYPLKTATWLYLTLITSH
jgi:hypothetical protein